MNDTTQLRPPGQLRTGPAGRRSQPDLDFLRSSDCPKWLSRAEAATAGGTTVKTIDRWRRLLRPDGTPRLRTRQWWDGVARCPVLVSRDDLLALVELPGDVLA